MVRIDLAQAAGRKQTPDLASAKQGCITVKFASHTGQPRQRSERIVLNDANESSGTRNTPHLLDEVRAGGGCDVVQHADGGHQIEAGVVKRKAATVEGAIVAVEIISLRLNKAIWRHINAGLLADCAAQQGMKTADPAANIQHCWLIVSKAPPNEVTQQIGLGAHEETVRQAGKVDRGLDNFPIIAAVAVEQFSHAGAPIRAQ